MSYSSSLDKKAKQGKGLKERVLSLAVGASLKIQPETRHLTSEPSPDRESKRKMPNPNEIPVLIQHCQNTLDLEKTKLEDEYFYQSLPLCVIDAVFSIGAHYTSTRNVVVRYCKEFRIPRIQANKDGYPLTSQQQSISDFIRINEEIGTQQMAEKIYKNNQRTSTSSGILKAEAALLFARALINQGICYFQEMQKLNRDTFKKEIEEIPGQGSGISLSYFYMLTGSEAEIKPDRMILRFLESALSRSIKTEESKLLLEEVLESLQPHHPHLNLRLLDNLIWNYQREKET